MVPVLSASPFELGEVSVLAELEFLPDQELMSLWEQTQLAMASIEGHGGSAKMARAYEYAVLMEMQRRLAGRSAHELFGSDDIRLEYDGKRLRPVEAKN